ncbi:hypothetical protein [Luteitalea sp.]
MTAPVLSASDRAREVSILSRFAKAMQAERPSLTRHGVQRSHYYARSEIHAVNREDRRHAHVVFHVARDVQAGGPNVPFHERPLHLEALSVSVEPPYGAGRITRRFKPKTSERGWAAAIARAVSFATRELDRKDSAIDAEMERKATREAMKTAAREAWKRTGLEGQVDTDYRDSEGLVLTVTASVFHDIVRRVTSPAKKGRAA